MRTWLKNLFGNSETRNQFPSGGFLQPVASSGVPVTPETAINCSTVYAAINAIATDVASLPFYTYKRTASGGKVLDPSHPLFEILYCETNPNTTSFNFERSLIMMALSWGNGYAWIDRDGDGEVLGLYLLESKNVKQIGTASDNLYYEVKGSDNSIRKFMAENVIHLACLGPDGIAGYSPITLAKQTIGLAQATEIYGSSFFGNSGIPSGFLKTANNMTKEARQELRESMERQHGGVYDAHKTGVLPNGVDWVATSIPPENAQFLATRQFSVIEICRWFNINPIRLQDYSHSSFANVEQAFLDYMTNTLRVWIENIEAEFSRKLLSRDERKSWFLRHDLSAYLRGDKAAQAAYYTQMFNIGVLTQNDILSSEDMNQIGPVGDKHYLPMNNLVAVEDQHKAIEEAKPVDTVEAPVAEDAKPEATDEVAPVDNIQSSAFNGAQTTSFKELVMSLAIGELPIGTVKGMIKIAFPTVTDEQLDETLIPLIGFKPAVPGEPAPASPSAPSPDVASAVRGVLVDSLNRMVRRQVEGIKRASKKEDFKEAVTEFFTRHASVFSEAISPSLTAYAAVVGKPLDIDALTDLVLVQDQRAIEEVEDLDSLLARWEESRAGEIVQSLEEN